MNVLPKKVKIVVDKEKLCESIIKIKLCFTVHVIVNPNKRRLKKLVKKHGGSMNLIMPVLTCRPEHIKRCLPEKDSDACKDWHRVLYPVHVGCGRYIGAFISAYTRQLEEDKYRLNGTTMRFMVKRKINLDDQF